MLVAFDLDDTLFSEADFVESACRAVEVKWGVQVPRGVDTAVAFDAAASAAGVAVGEIVNLYRTHLPAISMRPGADAVLDELSRRGHHLALVTDGRSVTQRNKIAALGLARWFAPENILISEETGAEKSSGLPFRLLSARFPGGGAVYVGDNPAKDVDAPLSQGWRVALLRGGPRNIHPQDFGSLPLGAVVIDDLRQLLHMPRLA